MAYAGACAANGSLKAGAGAATEALAGASCASLAPSMDLYAPACAANSLPAMNRLRAPVHRARPCPAPFLDAAVGVNQGRDLVLQNERQQPYVRCEFRTAPQNAGQTRRRQPVRSRAQSERGPPLAACEVEREILQRFIGGKTPSLPSGRIASLHDKKSYAGGITGTGVEQCAQNFLLRIAELDFRDRAGQIRRRRREGAGRLCGDLCPRRDA